MGCSSPKASRGSDRPGSWGGDTRFDDPHTENPRRGGPRLPTATAVRLVRATAPTELASCPPRQLAPPPWVVGAPAPPELASCPPRQLARPRWLAGPVRSAGPRYGTHPVRLAGDGWPGRTAHLGGRVV